MVKLTNLQKDALREVENIGSGNAATALSEMFGTETKISLSHLSVIHIKHASKKIKKHKGIIVALYAPLRGDFSGNTISVFFSKKDAFTVADLLLNRKIGTTRFMGMEEQRALKKMGDALSNAYTSSLSKFLKLKIKQLPQRITTIFGESIEDLVFKDFGDKKIHSLLLKTHFTIGSVNIKGEFALIAFLKSVNVLLKAIEKKLKKK